MNKLECLEDEAYAEGIDIIDYNFNSDNIKGLYVDGIIALNQKIETTNEKPVSWRKNWVTTKPLSEISSTSLLRRIGNRNIKPAFGPTRK